MGSILLAVVALTPRAGVATTVMEKSFAELCAEADVVFTGTVTDVRSRWVDPDRQAIETIVTFSDLISLFGVDGPTITLRFGGGEVGGVREEIAGVPRFAVGEQVVIFAHRERSVSPIVGFHQGSFRIVAGPNGPVVYTARRRPVVTGAGGALRMGSAGTAADVAVSLDTFLDRVRRALETRQDRRP